MGTTKIYGNANALISYSNPSAHLGSPPSFDQRNYSDFRYLLQSFGPIPESLRFRKIETAYIFLYAFRASIGAEIDCYELLAPFDPNTVTYNTKPDRELKALTSLPISPSSIPGYVQITPLLLQFSKIENVLENGLQLASSDLGFYTNSGQYPPYIELTHSDEDVKDYFSISAPSITTRLQITRETSFKWGYSQHDTLEDVVQTSAIFYWRPVGSSSSIEIPLTTETEITFPPGTFPDGGIEWRVVATSNTGQTSEIDWRTQKTAGLQFRSISPTSGYIPKNEATTFTWLIRHADYSSPDPLQTSAIFRYALNDSAEIVEIEIEGSEQTITIPAGTFTGSSVRWQVESRETSGVSVTSEWYTLSTDEAPSSAVSLSPNNAVLDGSAAIVFSWEHQISTGTLQTAFDLQISSDATNWSTLRSLATAETTASIPANTLPSGDLYWRVRTYNTDNIPGQWSDAAHVIIVAAPSPPSIAVTSTSPRFSVRWSQSGQQAYEMRLDGTVIERRYSAESAYSYSDYLPPGTYLLEVRIQNRFGLWSEWASAALPIVNEEGPAIFLTASGSHVVSLRWDISGTYDNYLVYRNGVQIGQTSENSYIDQFALGHAVYHVRGVHLDTGYFTLSPSVELVAAVDTIMIAAVENPTWIRLDKSMSKLRSTTMQTRRNVTYTHYIGTPLPSADVGEAVEQTYSLDCAWTSHQMQDALAFEQLCGYLVCVKTPSGRRIAGILNDISCTESKLIVSYSATITPVHWEESSR